LGSIKLCYYDFPITRLAIRVAKRIDAKRVKNT
jgi:hypothetical protein